MPTVGILGPDERLELLEGEIVPKRLFTADEFLRMAETGIIGPDERVELLDGEIVHMLPPGPWHGDAIAWLNEFFVDHRRGRWIVFVQSTLRVSDRDVPVPDLAILRRGTGRRYSKGLPRPEDTFLLIEAAFSSVQKDRERKSRIYARAGIPEYWIVNEPDRVVEVFRSPVGGEYRIKLCIRPGESLSPEAFPDVHLDTADLFAV